MDSAVVVFGSTCPSPLSPTVVRSVVPELKRNDLYVLNNIFIMFVVFDDNSSNILKLSISTNRLVKSRQLKLRYATLVPSMRRV